MTDHMEFVGSLENVITLLDSAEASYEPEQFTSLFYKDADGLSNTLFIQAS